MKNYNAPFRFRLVSKSEKMGGGNLFDECEVFSKAIDEQMEAGFLSKFSTLLLVKLRGKVWSFPRSGIFDFILHFCK